ncbi:Lipoteichoic acid synthase 2 [Paenibacillus plantiphilus]|uniref:Lipoteichoic acid synthase 2 n=1 Tax=Paenibacillus plantiphilus TaxID=2905650 RepID=A0ABN8GCV6_9BACL|nr:LTA synthase family protein [Paenibacillus plantiphilus]CAH1204097.1 Lipoteichoic acid synthase 2 [Paenibacillus plantiphilus]
MIGKLLTASRRGVTASLAFAKRMKGIDLLLFFVLMMLKLVMFDRFINVPNMAMNVDDVFTGLGALALVSFWTLWLPLRGRIVALVLLNLLLTGIIYSDLIYFRYFQDLISIPVLTQAGQVSSLGDSIGSLLYAADIWFFVDWLFIVPYAILVLFRRKDKQLSLSFAKQQRWRRIILRFSISLIVFATGLTLVFVPVNIAKRTWAQGLFVGNWWNLSLYNVTGVIGFHGYDIYRYANQHWFDVKTVPPEQIEAAKQWFAERAGQREGLESDAMFGKYAGKNVIMIQAEAFQNFVIGRSVNGVEVTPNINKLLEESVYFSNFYHQTSQGRTSDADLAANISLQPLPTGSVFIRYSHHQFDSLPATLKDNGYSTSVYHAYDGGFWNRNTMYHNMRYDTFYNKKDYTIDEPLGWSLGDDSFFRQSIDKMTKQKQPFYSFLISLSSHHPYALPESYQKLDLGDYKGTMFGDYLQSIHYVDIAFGHMVERLKSEGLWDESILLFYGDHDNSIRDWEPFEKFMGKPLNDLDRLKILKQVPLLVHLPGGDQAGVYDDAGGQIDLMPTILHLLGISTADKYLIGTPLVLDKPLAGKTMVLRNGAYTDGKVFYIPAEDGLPEHSKCLDAASGEPLDRNLCSDGAAAARKELVTSDLVVENDLIKAFRQKE